MGQIQRYVDPTGDMSMLQRHDQDIGQIMDELNRMGDQLDALNKSTKIIARDKVAVTVQAGQTFGTNSYTYGSGTIGSFICTVVSANDPDHSWPVPYHETQVNGSGVLDVLLIATASAANNVLTFNVRVGTSYTTPVTLTFYFYILEQPANTTGS